MPEKTVDAGDIVEEKHLDDYTSHWNQYKRCEGTDTWCLKDVV
jgi:hypothetical protein